MLKMTSLVFCKIVLMTTVAAQLVQKISGISPITEPSLAETQACKDQSILEGNDVSDVAFFNQCIQIYFRLEPPSDWSEEDKKQFSKPQFEQYLQPKSNPDKWKLFQDTSLRIQRFFKRHKNWADTITQFRNHTEDLLSIANARYVYVTYLLFELSGYKMKSCQREPLEKKIKYPREGVCWISPYGSTSATSDYDVGLIGAGSGLMVSNFNSKFEDANAFGKPSEVVFDTNIYAYSLEKSMPSLFVDLSTFYRLQMPKLDFMEKFQMLELAGAHIKMFRFHQDYYHQYKENAQKNLGIWVSDQISTVKDRRKYYNFWIKKFEDANKTRLAFSGINDQRRKHNEEYGRIVRNLNNNQVANGLRKLDDVIKFATEMSMAEVYAAEAYHTKGAMRHVVGVLQMRKQEINAEMTVMDYWVSMIENWADANKVFSQCNLNPAKICLLSMTKYLYRTFDALKNIQMVTGNSISVKPALIAAFGKKNLPSLPTPLNQLVPDPETLTKDWMLKYKGKMNEIPDADAQIFLNIVGCTTQLPTAPLTRECMDKIQVIVRDFDYFLVLTTSKGTTQNTILCKKNGTKKYIEFFSDGRNCLN